MAGKRADFKKRAGVVDEVIGLKMETLQNNIRWTGMLRLHHLKEDAQSLLSETQWPKKTGPVYFVCVSTGLLFDKQSGICRQSSRITLLMDSVKPIEGGVQGAGYFKRWRDKRIQDDGWLNSNQAKRGPKPKGQKANESENEGEEYAAIDE